MVAAPPPLTAQQIAVYGFTPAVNIDNGGNDIACYTDGSDAAFIREQCAADTTCVAYNVVAPFGSGTWSKGGGCKKGALGNIVAGTPTTLYSKANGTIQNADVMSWKPLPGKDFGGSDIKCYKNNEPLSVIQAACATTPGCVAYNQVMNANGIGWNGGCTKSAFNPNTVTNNSAVTTYYRG